MLSEYYLKNIEVKVDKFAKEHKTIMPTKLQIELLFIEIFNDLIEKKFVTQDKFDIFFRPQKVHTNRKIYKTIIKKGLLDRIFSLDGSKQTIVETENYIEERPSEFKQYCLDVLVFTYFIKPKKVDYDLGNILKFFFTKILYRLIDVEYDKQIEDLLDQTNIYQLGNDYNNFRADAELIREKYRIENQ